MCHNLIGWKSIVLGKWVREFQKEPMLRWHMARKGTSHLTCWTKQFGGGRGKGGDRERRKERRKEREKERRRMRREKLHLRS